MIFYYLFVINTETPIVGKNGNSHKQIIQHLLILQNVLMSIPFVQHRFLKLKNLNITESDNPRGFLARKSLLILFFD